MAERMKVNFFDKHFNKVKGYCRWCMRPHFGRGEWAKKEECIYCYQAWERGKKE